MDFKRVRKAITAGLAAAVALLGGALVNGDQPDTEAGWIALVFSAVSAGVVAGLATWRIRNAGTVNGSDPAPRRAGHV